MMRRYLTMRLCFLIVGFGAVSAASGDSCLIDPVLISPNLVTSVFGKTRNLSLYPSPQIHWGVDLQARSQQNSALGADLVAADSGTVIGAGFWGAGYGNRVALKRANGDIVLYNHLARIEPRLKSGGAVGFAEGGGDVGSTSVTAGEKIGVAGGTANHKETNERAIHLHLEYVTGYAGTKLRETNDGTTSTRSRYLRNPENYMCHALPHAPDAGSPGSVAPGTGGVISNSASASSDEQIADARQTQPTVTEGERYGIPDSAPYASYEGMSESQIVEAETLRRTLDTEWDEKLVGLGQRGVLMEIARIRAAKLWLENRIAEKQSVIEAMLSTKLAFETNQYLSPRVQAAFTQADQAAARRKVK